MSLYYNNNKYDFKISPDMVDKLLTSDNINKHITQDYLGRLIGLLPDGIQVFKFNIESY
jgi:hypothetical protein